LKHEPRSKGIKTALGAWSARIPKLKHEPRSKDHQRFWLVGADIDIGRSTVSSQACQHRGFAGYQAQ
ncbi:hypothetical protein, partial [Halopseudomonas formosensis]|uniref:hypothetical protein n=1 Tax=Halopseudomonas formosensis TaxID=1002526 RepID=UPI001C430FBB